jgi:hypothetical protein
VKPEPREPVLMTRAEVRTADEARGTRHKAHAAQAYAKKAGLTNRIIVTASTIKVQTDRRLGQLLTSLDLANSAPGSQDTSTVVRSQDANQATRTATITTPATTTPVTTTTSNYYCPTLTVGQLRRLPHVAEIPANQHLTISHYSRFWYGFQGFTTDKLQRPSSTPRPRSESGSRPPIVLIGSAGCSLPSCRRPFVSDAVGLPFSTGGQP